MGLLGTGTSGTEARRDGAGALQLPLSLYLSPAVPEECAASLRALVERQPPGFCSVRLVESEEGALLVLHEFKLKELSALEKRRCRVIGVPFVERLLRNPSVIEEAPKLPLFDIIYRGAFCCTGLPQASRAKCMALARWMGALYSDELGPDVGVLVAGKVSIHPESKYQAAFLRKLPVVRLSYIEAMWEAKREVDMEPHLLPALAGMSLCFDPLEGGLLEKYRPAVVTAGASLQSEDAADVVIVRDTLSRMYQSSAKMGIITASPRWLDHCLQLRRCAPIVGDLEVKGPRSAALPSGGVQGSASVGLGPPPLCDGGTTSGACDGEPMAEDDECGISLAGCVICLAHLESGESQAAAKAMAWRCGAYTTMDQGDPAITHVLFKVVAKKTVPVHTPIVEDKVVFLDVSWLEACAQGMDRLSESAFPQQAVRPPSTSIPAPSTTLRSAGTATSAATEAAPVPLPQPQPATEHHQINGDGGAAAPLATGGPAQGPVPQPLPLTEMRSCVVRITALEDSDESHRARVFLEELAHFLGAKVAQQSTKWSELTHIVCVVRGLMDSKQLEGALRRQIPVVTVQWLFDSFRRSARQPEDWYTVSCLQGTALSEEGVMTVAQSFAAALARGQAALPLAELRACVVRITALEASKESYRFRVLLEELTQLLGAKVAQQSTKWNELTHVVCVVQSLMDAKQYDGAMRRRIPVVTVHWLFDSFRKTSRQPEDWYAVSSPQRKVSSSLEEGGGAAAARSFAAVLAGHDILISPSALGSEPRLPQMAEELGARAIIWRSSAEVEAALNDLGVLLPTGATEEARGRPAAPSTGEAGLTPASGSSPASASGARTLVVVDREEVAEASWARCIARLQPEGRHMLVLAPWLMETFRQRRRLPVDGFAALATADTPEKAPNKRQRLGEAEYAWQPEGLKRLEELAEDSKKSAIQSKVQQKVSEGLRLAELRHEPSRARG